MMLRSAFVGVVLCVFIASCVINAQAQSAFINEIHYDNVGTDTGEFIEIAGPAGMDVTGWRIVRYNGANPAAAVVYTNPAAVETLAGTIPDTTGSGFGFLFIDYPTDGLQNGPNDGVALVNAAGAVVQFLCYESPATAASGPAAGQTCTDIGVAEGAATPVGNSLQLNGTGTVYVDFTWAVPKPATKGCVNAGQTLGGVSGNPAGGCAPPPPPVVRLIHDVQGSGLTSALTGQLIAIEGIVVGDFQGTSGLPGFFVQEEDSDADADPATSEGIFVFDTASPAVSVNPGDKVRVVGTVSEFSSSGITLTELINPAVTVISSGNTTPAITDISFPAECPTCLERFEGMLVRINRPMTVTETFNHGAFGELGLSAHGRKFQPTNLVNPGPAAVALQLANDLERIILDDGSNLSRANLNAPYPEGGLSANNTARTGDVVNTPITGVLDHRFGAYRIHPTNLAAITFSPSENPRPASPPGVGGRVRVAAFNVLNYFTTLDTGIPACGPFGTLDCRGANSAFEFNRQRDKIIRAVHLLDAHVTGLMELENNPGASLADIISGLNVLARTHKWDFISTGTIGTDAIKVGLIYQPAFVRPVGAPAILTSAMDPRVMDNLNRPALAQTFERLGQRSDLQRFTVVVNHFKSKGSDCNDVEYEAIPDVDTGDGQGNCNLTRTSMASALIDWLAGNPTGDPTGAENRKVLVLGDLNVYAKEDPVRALTSTTFTKDPVIHSGNPNATLRSLVELLLGDEAYSYVFQGQTGYLDHALANPVLERLTTGIGEWHINADEPVAIDYNTEWTATIAKTQSQVESLYDSNVFRSSDHDPVIVGFNPLCGDFDDNGEVDAADLLFLRGHIGEAVTQQTRRLDFDEDGLITQQDFLRYIRCQAAFKAQGTAH